METDVITVEIAKLELQPGDIVVLRPRFPVTMGGMVRLNRALESVLPPDVKAVVLEDCDLEVLSGTG